MWAAKAHLHTKWHLDPSSRLATIDMGQKVRVVVPHFRPTSLPSGILIHPAICPQQIWAKNWGLCPFGEGELGPHLTQCGQGRGLYLHAKFHLDPSNRLVTVHERDRQTDMTDNGPIA